MSKNPFISLAGNERFKAYHVDAGPSTPRLLVLPEIYGINEEVRRVADFYGTQGYSVLAPDLSWRVHPGLVFAYAEREAARKAVAQLLPKEIIEDISLAASTLSADGEPVALLAFGWSAQFALQAARPGHYSAVATYYGGNLAAHIATASSVGVPLQFHFAELDTRTPPELRNALRSALADRDDVEIFTHRGVDHGFANHGRVEYDAPAASRAQAQTLDFLQRARQHVLAAA